MKANSQSGFTLYELLVTLLVAGILLGIGVPNIMAFQRNGLMSAAANQLITGLLAARAEAVKRQVPVTLCASTNPTAPAPTCSITGAGANGGFIVWVDWDSTHVDANGAPTFTATDGNAVVNNNEAILMRSAAPGGTMNVWGNSGYISYGTNGFRRTATGSAQAPLNWLVLCDDRGNSPTSGQLSAARAIRIDPTGRGIVLQEITDVATAVGNVPAATCP